MSDYPRTKIEIRDTSGAAAALKAGNAQVLINDTPVLIAKHGLRVREVGGDEGPVEVTLKILPTELRFTLGEEEPAARPPKPPRQLDPLPEDAEVAEAGQLLRPFVTTTAGGFLTVCPQHKRKTCWNTLDAAVGKLRLHLQAHHPETEQQ